MKPKEMKPETVYRILDRETFSLHGAYSRAYCTEYDFASPNEARSSNCDDIYKDRAKYRVAKYRVTYELIDDDVDPPNDEEMEAHRIAEEKRAALEAEMDALGLEGMACAEYRFEKAQDAIMDEVFASFIADNP